jgi:hypothetical protein
VVVPDERTRELRQRSTAREELVKMGLQLKNIGRAALARNGLASHKADFASQYGWDRLAGLDGLPASDRFILDMALRQVPPLEQELMEIERWRSSGRSSMPVAICRGSNGCSRGGASASSRRSGSWRRSGT